jgi:mannose-6-phosphate isomerase-like protein (cupin superfamily)
MNCPQMLVPKFVAPGEGRAFIAPGGDTSVPKITARETADRFSLAEYTVLPDAGPPLHSHTREDEAFWILEGEVTFWIGSRESGRSIVAGTGSFVFGPRNTPHCFKNRTRRPAKLLLIVSPPANFETFYETINAPVNDTPPTDQQLIERIGRHAPDFGIEILGPNPL